VTAPFLVKDAVDALIDEKTIEHLDFDPLCSVQVEPMAIIFGIVITTGRSEPCARPAIAEFRCRVCSIQALICGGHLDAITAAPLVSCMECGHSGAPRDVYAWRPLPKAG
jgi:hypothetical protein